MPISPYRKQDLIGQSLLAALGNVGNQYQTNFLKAQDESQQRDLMQQLLLRSQVAGSVQSPSQLMNPDGTMNPTTSQGEGNMFRPDLIGLLSQLHPDTQNLIYQIQKMNQPDWSAPFGGQAAGYSQVESKTGKTRFVQPGLGRPPTFETRTLNDNTKPTDYRIGYDASGKEISRTKIGEAFRTDNSAAQGAATQRANDARLDKSYQFHTTQLGNLSKNLQDRVDRLERLQISIDEKSPQADALIAPELLTAMAGGQGSGLRMNEAEIARIVGGRSHWESLKAAVNKWQSDPTKALSVTDAQREQIRSLMSKMSDKVRQKVELLTSAQEGLTNATDVQSIEKLYAKARKDLNAIDFGEASFGRQHFTVNGKGYEIPDADVEEFKKDMGIK